MAKYCLDLLKHPKKLAAFRENARQRVIDHFDINTIVPMYEDVYNLAISKP
jgi:glycosyltransferase involved in cell wall biosynthesis